MSRAQHPGPCKLVDLGLVLLVVTLGLASLALTIAARFLSAHGGVLCRDKIRGQNRRGLRQETEKRPLLAGVFSYSGGGI